MNAYKIKKRHIIISCSIFGSLMVVSILLYVLTSKVLFAFLGLVSTVMLGTFFLISKTAIITTDQVIKKSDLTGVAECSWDMIYSVSTFRMGSSGNYSTTVSWAREPQYRAKITGVKWPFSKDTNSGVIDLSDHYDGYYELLKEIKAKAVNAKIDEMTLKVMESSNV